MLNVTMVVLRVLVQAAFVLVDPAHPDHDGAEKVPQSLPGQLAALEPRLQARWVVPGLHLVEVDSSEAPIVKRQQTGFVRPAVICPNSSVDEVLERAYP